MILAPVSVATSRSRPTPLWRWLRLAGAGAPAAGILLVWAMLWAWMIVDVVRPLSRLPFQTGGSQAAVERQRS